MLCFIISEDRFYALYEVKGFFLDIEDSTDTIRFVLLECMVEM